MPVETDALGPDQLFKQVTVPSGTTVVRFTFLPPSSAAAVSVAIVALIVLLGSAFGEWRKRKPEHGSRPEPTTARATD